MIKPTLLLFAAIALPAAGHADMHKCEIGGATSYQEAPCPGAEVPITDGGITLHEAPDYRPLRQVLPPPSRPQPRQRPRATDTFTSSTTAHNNRVRAQARGELVPGMTKGQVLAMLGEPDHGSDFTNANGESCHRWVWINPRFLDKRRYRAIICNGRVTR